jgi:type II secretory pathway pseudopilin PulG
MSRYSRYSKWVWTIGLMGLSTAAFADEPKPRPPQEPVGFVAGGVIGAFAAGPIGAVVGAGLGTWLGNRVHRASDAKKAEAQVALLESDKSQLQTEKSTLASEKNQLAETNQALSAKLDDLSQKVQTAQTAKQDASEVLDGLQGDVLFRTGYCAPNSSAGPGRIEVPGAQDSGRWICRPARYDRQQYEALAGPSQCSARPAAGLRDQR